MVFTYDVLKSLVPEWNPRFLKKIRWFRRKNGDIQTIRLVDLYSIPKKDNWVILFIDVYFSENDKELYFFPARFNLGKSKDAALSFKHKKERWSVAELTNESCFSELLYDDYKNERKLKCANGTLIFRRIKKEPSMKVVPLGGSSTNSVLQLSRSSIFKLFRKLEEGVNPEIEIGEYLTTQSVFSAFAPLEGSITYFSNDKKEYPVGIFQYYLFNDGSFWDVTQSHLKNETNGVSEKEYLRMVSQLAKDTAELHSTLANNLAERFSPEVLDESEIRVWGLEEEIWKVFSEIKQFAKKNKKFKPLLESVLKQEQAIYSYVRACIGSFESVNLGEKIRIHGDFHLGQVLTIKNRFAIIDYEGEPIRSLESRGLKTTPLRDIAGMIRSFHYAAFAALGQKYSKKWIDDVSSLFLKNYTTRIRSLNKNLLPENNLVIENLLSLLKLQKAIYEFHYEINNRPDWAVIPLHGLLDVVHQIQNKKQKKIERKHHESLPEGHVCH